MTTIKPKVLLVDDNPADIDLTSEAFSRCPHPHSVHAVNDGVEALAFLHREGKYAQEARPDLIVLDLNLPRKDGRAVLAEVKADLRLRSTPVIIFSTSQAPSFELGANSYVSKPSNLKDFMSTVASLAEFWLGHAQFPPKEER
jgi:CheY-like chemotaxis protein